MKISHPLSSFLALVLLLASCTALPVEEPTLDSPPTGFPQAATDAPVFTPTVTTTPTPGLSAVPQDTGTPVAVVEHVTSPGNPGYLDTQLVRDCSQGYAYETYNTVSLIRGCDSWGINYLERPFPPDLGNYLGFLDIELAQFGSSGGWFFARMRVYDAAFLEDGNSLYYLFEMDQGFDGRGDILIVVENLPLDATQWTVTGVRVWQDINGDVGGEKAIRSDASASGDGYETLLFDQGQGSDPDLVWARRSPNSPKSIEFAFKPSLLAGDESFLWWGWAFLGNFDPASFDLVDRYTELYQLDNTCSMEFNGSPQGFPNGCRAIQPTPTPSPACIKTPNPGPGWIWFPDKCRWELWN